MKFNFTERLLEQEHISKVTAHFYQELEKYILLNLNFRTKRLYFLDFKACYEEETSEAVIASAIKMVELNTVCALESTVYLVQYIQHLIEQEQKEEESLEQFKKNYKTSL